MLSEAAVEQGYYDRGFGNKVKALAYQKLIKTLFPEGLCALCDTGRYYDMLGHIHDTKD
ncbi:MAG: hypothetical protein QOD99_2005 [Chthoniobacter sp.]|nr:hypothetical protein [Chthoniobacter sp.]